MTEKQIGFSVVPSPAHQLPGHPEGPHRLETFQQKIHDQFPDQLMAVEANSIEPELLENVHSQAYIEAIKEASERGPGFLDYGDTYVTTASYEAACQASGTVIEVAKTIMSGPQKTGFALVRPPGHHAFRQRAEGFCLFNNIAICAKWLQTQGIERVLIVDFDVHHGNGTEALFMDDPSILFLSTHQWGIYPGSGGFKVTGMGEGEGTVINVPLPAGAGDQAFDAVYSQILGPAADRFQPEFLLISAGYDAHWRDPLAGLTLSLGGYRSIAKFLKALAVQHCEGRAVYVLEGGYDPEVLFHGITTCMAVQLDLPYPDPIGGAPGEEPGIEDLLETITSLHRL
jgi:acetoin utilization deacetylase AcuC-like enzyme